MPVYNTNHEFLLEALDSVLNQSYPYWELCIADDSSTDEGIKSILLEYIGKDSRVKCVFRKRNGGICAASNSAWELSTGEFVALVDHDDVLSPDALFTICHYINLHDNEVDLLYSDEDKLNENGKRIDPYFKGGWNRRLVFQQNFVAHLGVYRKAVIGSSNVFREGFEGSQDYDLLLRFIKRVPDERIIHVPHILYHWRKSISYHSFSTDRQDKSDEAAKRALEEYFEGTKEILPGEGLCGCWRLIGRDCKSEPLVSVIIPTRDHASILRNCIQGLLEKTDYSNFEIIVMDNGSQEKDALVYLDQLEKEMNIRVMHDDRPFNYSRLNNNAACQAKGDFLLFMNNDVAVIEAGWLGSMVAAALDGNTGAVGAKLLYKDSRAQHVGVVTGIYEVAGHLYRFTPDSDGGYFGLTLFEKNVSAVTGACILVSRSVFWKVGGFDEKNLTVSFNDVDLCLKILDAGYEVVYTPYAKLYHLESLSRGEDITKAQREQNYQERRFMHEKYGRRLLEDVFYNPNLSLTNEDGDLKDPPRVCKPWRNWIEFVCPFHRGDVLLGLQVAYTASMHGIHVRMHVSEALINWLEDFDCAQLVKIEPVAVGMPSAEQTSIFLSEAIKKVALREDSSGRIICSHPARNLEDMGIDLVENMLRQFGLPINTKLVGPMLRSCPKERQLELSEKLNHSIGKTVLLHPKGGWSLKSMTPEIIGKVIRLCHKAGCAVVQIGGESDPVVEEADGTLLENLPLRDWGYLFRSSRAVIGVDSWTAHFASLVNADQAILYSSTNDRDVGSKRHFANVDGKCVVIPSRCAEAPCNGLSCKLGYAFCNGMNVTEKINAVISEGV